VSRIGACCAGGSLEEIGDEVVSVGMDFAVERLGFRFLRRAPEPGRVDGESCRNGFMPESSSIFGLIGVSAEGMGAVDTVFVVVS